MHVLLDILESNEKRFHFLKKDLNLGYDLNFRFFSQSFRRLKCLCGINSRRKYLCTVQSLS